MLLLIVASLNQYLSCSKYSSIVTPHFIPSVLSSLLRVSFSKKDRKVATPKGILSCSYLAINLITVPMVDRESSENWLLSVRHPGQFELPVQQCGFVSWLKVFLFLWICMKLILLSAFPCRLPATHADPRASSRHETPSFLYI